ncbi:MAG: DNA repair protein RecO [Ruminococcaceae bacterium]|nr:DNA repair protein RecO [Oscillospiraceae bacterium]
MGLVKTEGIVLRETKYGEHDKMLTVFTKDWGTVSVSARGVRGGKRRCTGAGLFCYSRFVLFQGRNSYQLNECELIRSFHRICEDLLTMSCGAYLCEITSREQLENELLMKLLLNALAMLEEKKPVWQVKGVFELRAATGLGFSPHVFRCVRCGNEEQLTSFSCELGGVVCKKCQKGEMNISQSVLRAMQYVQMAGNPFSFSLAEDKTEEFSAICEKFLIHYLEKQPKTLEFLKSLL